MIKKYLKEDLSKAKLFDTGEPILRYERILKVIEFIEKKIGLKFNQIKQHKGGGHYGDVFEVNDKVIKFGFVPSWTDLKLVEKVMKENPRGIVKVFSVLQIPNSIISDRKNLFTGTLAKPYLSIMESLEVIPSTEITKLIELEVTDLLKEEKSKYEGQYWEMYHLIHQGFRGTFTLDEWKTEFKYVFNEVFKRTKEKFYLDMWYAIDWCIKNNLKFLDFHSKNVMYDPKTDEYKIIDLL